MWKSKIIYMLLAGISLQGFSQTYGNEWIDVTKNYYRIAVFEDGVYRITATELAQAGVPVSTTAVNRFQLFRRGVEQAIIAADDNNDGRVDYIEFYGKKNDGASDTDLYVQPEAQPHLRYNLFADSSAYFLTYHQSNISGKRMELTTLKDVTGLSAETEHIEELIQIQTEAFSTGQRYGSSGDIQNPSYEYGEGWTGSNISKNQTSQFSFNLEGKVTSGTNPLVELVLSGVSSFEHVVIVSVGQSTSTLREIGQVTFEARESKLYSQEALWSDVANNGTFIVQVEPVGITGQTDVVSVAYAIVDFAQSYAIETDAKTFHPNPSGASRGYLSITSASASVQRALDVTDSDQPEILSPTAFSDRLEIIFDDFTVPKDIHVFSTPLEVGSIAPSGISDIDIASANYLMVSHPDLDQLTDGINPVSAYEEYRASALGGGFTVLKMDIQEVYDHFSYGDPSPLAIRRLCTYALDIADPLHLFLIGRGTMPNTNYYRDPGSITHYVPTFGFPGSDLLFAVHPNDGDIIPDIAVGRLNAYTSSDVKSYLDKVVEMEATPFDDLWRKRLVHLSGGLNSTELAIFENYVNSFRSVALGDFLGGSVTSKGKSNSSAVEAIDISAEVNNGVSLITFFGHSSSIVTDIEIGRASDPDEGYSNSGKYPIILINGCNAGGIFGATGFTFGEDWMNTPSKGSLGVIANSDLALSSALKNWNSIFYEQGFATEDRFGLSIGEIINNVASDYFNTIGAAEDDQSQVYQTVFQGDPAIKLFGAQQPDFAVDLDGAFASSFDNNRVLASEDSFSIELPVKNFGKTVKDSLLVGISRTLPNGTIQTSEQLFPSVLYQDTLSLIVYNQPDAVNEGVNLFTITVDPNSELSELNESNNVSMLELFIPRGNTIPLYPLDESKTAATSVDLVWQSANQLEQERSYALEIDTMASFTSSFKSSEIVQGGLLNRFSLDLTTLPDSTTVFWRTRFEQAVDNEDTSWVNYSFTKVEEQGAGWLQTNHAQIIENEFSGVTYDRSSGVMEFLQTETSVSVNTHGVGSPNSYDSYQVIVDGVNLLATDNAADPVCKKLNAINAVVFDKESSQPIRPLGISGIDVFNDLVCGRLPQMIHNFSENEVLGSSRYLERLIDAMDNGDMILLFSFDSMAFSNWDAQLLASLNSVGVADDIIAGLTDGQPVIMLGRKGDMAGSALSVVSNGQGMPVKDQSIVLPSGTKATGRFISGDVSSTIIGPANSWDDFRIQVEAEASDDWICNLVGISPSGNRTEVFSGQPTSIVDLSSVDANMYPFLSLELAFEDDANLTPPKLNSWSVDYESPVEGILIPSTSNSATLDEGGEFVANYAFLNISEQDFSDSLTVSSTFTNLNSSNQSTGTFKIGPPAAGDSIPFQVTNSTRSFAGDNSLAVRVVANETEQYLQNNSILLANAAFVEEDQTNPVLDVTFDGGYIMDGDIVSPNPNILVRFKDENEFLFKEDTTGMTIELKESCETCIYERVRFTDPKLTYTPASESSDFELNYSPGPLADGIYSLRVQGEDESGNDSGLQPYEISFEVINESTITHFYPYPNPFSTSTRFVYTLTGSTIPDQIKIQIMTVSGRVVREITQEEFGVPRIGNNISDYAWDGRDEYGDQLANGVYLYKVFIQQNGESIDHRNTSADKAFKNGFGKMYLLR